MTGDQYLLSILSKYAPSTTAAQAQVQLIYPVIQNWAGQYLVECIYSGSIAKGTAISISSDADVFISLSSTTPDSLANIYSTLSNALSATKLPLRRQNVSIGITAGGCKIDFTPGKRHSQYGYDHTVYRSRAQTWTKTNVKTHVAAITASGRTNEIRLIKIWRSLRALDFPSFYLELVVIDCLKGSHDSLSNNVWKVLSYLSTAFPNMTYSDPANSNNTVSDDLTTTEKLTVKTAAQLSLKQQNWNQIVW